MIVMCSHLVVEQPEDGLGPHKLEELLSLIIASLFVRQCRSPEEFPNTIRTILLEVHRLTAVNSGSKAVNPVS